VLAGHAMTLDVIRRPLTSEARVGSQVSPCEICGGQSVTGTGISPCIWFSLVSIIPLMHRTHLHLHGTLIRRTNGRNLRTFQKQCAFGEKYFRFNKPAAVDAACFGLKFGTHFQSYPCVPQSSRGSCFDDLMHGEQSKLWSSLLCNYLHPVTSPFCAPKLSPYQSPPPPPPPSR